MTRRGRSFGAVAVAVLLTVTVGLSTFAAAGTTTRTSTPERPGARLRAVDGGLGYTKKFTTSLPDSRSFFPLAVWSETVTNRSDIATDKAAGLNTYLQLTNDSRFKLLENSGMHVIGGDTSVHSEQDIEGWFVSDEADMRFGPGWSDVAPGDDPQHCADRGALNCGFTFQRERRDEIPDDGRLRYANYGKGVMFWNTDQQASTFVNRFQDIVSADLFWFTDPNICGSEEGGRYFAGGNELPVQECRRAANYGAVIDRVRSLVKPAGSKPVWAFIEIGHPFDRDDAPTITPEQIHAAVWSSLIHGARGVIYFNHSFAGSCFSYHVLRDACYGDARAAVTRTNQQITALAPVLNAPTVTGVTTTTGAVDTMTKWSGNTYYVFAGSTGVGPGDATFQLACTGNAAATVLGEQRTIPVIGGRFTDTFADGNAVHLYRIEGGTTCEPR